MNPALKRFGRALRQTWCFWGITWVLALCQPGLPTLVFAQSSNNITTFTWTPPSPDPAGIVYLPSSNSLLISDSEVDEMPALFTGDNVYEASLSGSLIRVQSTISFSSEPTGLTLNSDNQHLFYSDDDAMRIFEVDPGPDGQFHSGDDVVRSFSTSAFGSTDPEGVAYDTWRGHLLIADGHSAEIYDVGPGPNGVFDGAAPNGDDQIGHFDTAILGLTDPEGIAFNPDNGHLLIISQADNIVVETSVDGNPIRVIDLSYLNMMTPADLTIAPSSTLPGQKSLYIVDRRIDNDDDPNENDGMIYEVSLEDDDGVPEETASISVRVSSGSDDAEETQSGQVYLTSTDLDLTNDLQGNGGNNQVVGLRFRNVTIPPGAVILSASIQFQVDEAGTSPASLFFHGEAADNASAFSSANNNISSRPRTTASVTWAAGAWPTVGASGSAQTSADLSPVIQEIINRPGWQEGQAMAIIISGSGDRIAEAHEGSSSGAPNLSVTYSGESQPPVPLVSIDDITVSEDAGTAFFSVRLSQASTNDIDISYETLDGSAVAGQDYAAVTGSLTLGAGALTGTIPVDLLNDSQSEGTESFSINLTSNAQIADPQGIATIQDDDPVVNETVTISIGVSDGSDDAEETQSGQVSLGSTDLDLTNDLQGNGGNNQVVGLRFRNVTIPPGAVILSASIQFQVDEAGSSPASLVFHGEAEDDASVFSSANNNITSRTVTTASVNWAADPWPGVGASGAAQQSADLSPVIQEIINRPGWQEGQALAIIISGYGDRIAEAYEGSSTAEPSLQVTYSGASQPDMPTVSLDDVTVSEDAGIAFFTVRLSNASSEEVSIDFETRDGSAVEGQDYVGTFGHLILASGSLTGTISVEVLNDTLAEDTESFSIELTSEAQMADPLGVATIQDDDVVEDETITISARISSGDDDAEETLAGQVSLGSTDLDLTNDLRGNGGNNQTVGLRFRNVTIPPGAVILSASIQFQVDEAGSSSAALIFHGEAVDDAPGFSSTNNNISSRTLTSASVTWEAAPWPTVGSSGSDQKSADLSPVVQEIVDRSGWRDGQALVILISGNGDRIAEAYEGSSSGAPNLEVTYKTVPSIPLTKNRVESTGRHDEMVLEPYPNPFNNEILISYTLERSVKVSLVVFNMRGQRLRILVDDVQAAGSQTMIWDGLGERGKYLGSGVYFVELIANQNRMVRKITMLK